MAMRASKSVTDDGGEDGEEAVPENKLMLDSPEEAFQLSTTAFDFLYDIELSGIQVQALTLMQTV